MSSCWSVGHRFSRNRAPIYIKLKSARDNRAENACCFGSRKIRAAPARDYFLCERSGDSGIEAVGNRYGPAQLSQYPIYTLRADTRAPSAPRSVPYLFWSSSIP
jgi:hypothetical protein